MFTLLSPSKTMDNSVSYDSLPKTELIFLNELKNLVEHFKRLKKQELSELMNISDKLAELNYKRFQSFPEDLSKSKETLQSLCFYKGDVYTDIDISNYKLDDFNFAQNSIRILSGLYGILRPLDLIYAYRLEMGINTKNIIGKTLYEFWSDKITTYLNKECNDYIINLASNEYSEVINLTTLKAKVFNIVFKDNHKGQLKVIGLNAKKARGAMANFIIKNRITTPKDLLNFTGRDYKYTKELSNENTYTFIR
ncbi:MAG: YaaA family protein [Sphingobacteriia bacterium]|nr:YaaA family protein [Sphingobacteriia bacterium]